MPKPCAVHVDLYLLTVDVNSADDGELPMTCSTSSCTPNSRRFLSPRRWQTALALRLSRALAPLCYELAYWPWRCSS